MGFFDTCEPEFRFSMDGYRRPSWPKGTECSIHDWDQRRTITIATLGDEQDDEFLYQCLREWIDTLPADTTFLRVAEDGQPVYYTNHIDLDQLLIPFYPRITDYPPGVPVLQRSQLYEVERTGLQVDHAAYYANDTIASAQHIAFKYYFSKPNMRIIWHEANCLIRIPEHPGIVPFHSLVVDRIPGEDIDRVVGFATPFIEGGTIEVNVKRPFKMKHLKQLFETIDYLNLHLGIVHGDVHMRNLLMCEATDQIKLFDFNWAARLGWLGEPDDLFAFAYDADRNDVKDAMFTVYEIITRDTHFRDDNNAYETEVSMITGITQWEKHDDVVLDAEPCEYRKVLEDWVETRQQADKAITHYTHTPLALSWPSFPELDLVWDTGDWGRPQSRLRQSLIRYGENFLNWQRPPSSNLPLPEGRLLLANGEIVTEEVGEMSQQVRHPGKLLKRKRIE